MLTTLANMDAIVDLGTRLVKLIGRVTGAESPRNLVIRDATTAGILAVGLYQPSSDLVGGHILGTQCVSGGGPGVGFDARDVWVTSVVLSNRKIVEIHVTAAGEFLRSRFIRPKL